MSWENLNRKLWCSPSNWLGFPVNFPIIQFCESWDILTDMGASIKWRIEAWYHNRLDFVRSHYVGSYSHMENIPPGND